ncbi:MAG: hypothetical protein JSW28_04880, partial [Thermoplasmata archaeon]
MVAQKYDSPNEGRMKIGRGFATWGVFLILILSLVAGINVLSAPVVIDEDSGGSWSDTFDDEEGIEVKSNVTIQEGDVFLGYLQPFDPTNWTKYGMVVDKGGAGDNDSNTVCHPWVMKEGSIYKMWYAGWDGVNYRIMYATSNDGVVWNKQGLVVDKGDPGENDSVHASEPIVIKDGSEYKMWYNGFDGSYSRTLYATSPNGTDWTKQGVVLDKGTMGQLDDGGTRPYTVIKENGEYKMWYGGFDGSNWKTFYANSTSGTSWNRQGLVLDLGPDPRDDTHIGGCKILNESGTYRMWYSGHGGASGDYRIFYASSPNETDWTKEGLALDHGNPGAPDEIHVGFPSVIKDDDGFYKMWYQGGPGTNMKIFLAISPYPLDMGYILSNKISLPTGQTWSRLVLNKDEPGVDNHINVSILDGETNETILGYENLTGSDIDISSIDYVAHPTIRLQANLIGNGSASPVLSGWTVEWLDTIPPVTPTGLTVNNPFTGYSLILSWDMNSEQDMVCYVLYYSLDNATFSWLANISSEQVSFIHYGLSVNVTWYYMIAAADEVPNQSPFSEAVEGTPDRDYDGDGIGDIPDLDDDNDGILDDDDPYPLNPLNDIETTIDYMNTTIEDVQTRVIIIQTILENLNLTELLNAVNYLNQTLPPKMEDLSTQLAGVNDSLSGRVTDAETNILSELANVDASLSDEIQNLLVSITDDITGMNASLSDELTSLMDNMTSEHDALQQWLDIVIDEVDTNLTATNDTLHQQLNSLDNALKNFHDSLKDDLDKVRSDIEDHDEET